MNNAQPNTQHMGTGERSKETTPHNTHSTWVNPVAVTLTFRGEANGDVLVGESTHTLLPPLLWTCARTSLSLSSADIDDDAVADDTVSAGVDISLSPMKFLALWHSSNIKHPMSYTRQRREYRESHPGGVRDLRRVAEQC